MHRRVTRRCTSPRGRAARQPARPGASSPHVESFRQPSNGRALPHSRGPGAAQRPSSPPAGGKPPSVPQSPGTGTLHRDCQRAGTASPGSVCKNQDRYHCTYKHHTELITSNLSPFFSNSIFIKKINSQQIILARTEVCHCGLYFYFNFFPAHWLSLQPKCK